MPRVSDLLDSLARRPATCRHCGSALVTVAGSGDGLVTVCPGCDLGRPPRDHRAVHFAAIETCPECRRDWGWV